MKIQISSEDRDYESTLADFVTSHSFDAYEIKEMADHLCEGFEYVGFAKECGYFTLIRRG